MKMSILIVYTFIYSVFSLSSLQQEERKVFVAYMGPLREGEYSPSLHHAKIIKKIVHPSFRSRSLIRSYERSFNGFAAYLSEEEKQKLTRIDGVVSVFPCEKFKLQTTRSWDFMGLSTTIERRPTIESDIIIGVIDSGIWPESESFNDEGFSPIPSKWKGGCFGGKDFMCNKKIIGARVFNIERTKWELSARDTDGHGTHVASIIAGNQVSSASYYGIANGIARGGVPSARLAVYKVCDREVCPNVDILSAFDHAIADGVDLISISLSPEHPTDLTSDSIAIGAFHALERGILTVQCAGNEGPFESSITSYAPWILTVAASDTDRRIVDKLLLGKDITLIGNAINAFQSSDEAVPLVYGKEVTSSCSETNASNCVENCINSSLVVEKVVLCDKNPFLNLETIKTYGALGCIYRDSWGENISVVTSFTSVALSGKDFNLIKTYKESTKKPEAQILKSEPIDNPGAPFVATFSSRGPSRFMYDLIKPDVIAPGVEILAAFSPLASPSGYSWDKGSTKFNILSGTSMACPHVTAAAAFVKSFYPEWSPSAIKSALMTTAWEFNASLYLEGEFAYGSGHINPIKAIDPGLVYETFAEDYLRVWCNISEILGGAIRSNASCLTKMTPKEINYPSMAVRLDMENEFVVSFSRTVTNVGRAYSRYVASIEGDRINLNITIEPNTLKFTTLNQKKGFMVIVKGRGMEAPTIKRMSLLWTDGVHTVRCPIVVYPVKTSGEETPTPPMFNNTPPRFHKTSGGETTLTSSRFHVTFLLILMMMNFFVLRPS